MLIKRICLIAVLSALISGVKLAMAFLPNIEVVTLLFIVITLIFGFTIAISTSLVFVLLEILIWGYNPWWVTLYIVYWPLLVGFVYLASELCKGKTGGSKQYLNAFKASPQKTAKQNFYKKSKVSNLTLIVVIAIGILMTIMFGVISTIIEIIFMEAIGTGQFWEFVFWRYIAGIPFFIVHVSSNAITLPILLPKVVKSLERVRI